MVEEKVGFSNVGCSLSVLVDVSEELSLSDELVDELTSLVELDEELVLPDELAEKLDEEPADEFTELLSITV